MPIDVTSDEDFRFVLRLIAEGVVGANAAVWHTLGEELLARARRDSRGQAQHADDFFSAYVVAALEAIKLRPTRLIDAERPWAVLTVIAKHAGQRAVGDNVVCGLTGRDRSSHRLRHSDAPRVLSYESLLENRDIDAECA